MSGADWTGRRALVTGASGFLGHHVTGALLERGAHVTALVRDVVPDAPFFRDGLSGRVDVVRGAVEDLPVVQRALAEYEVDTVFHLAAQAIVGVANRSPLSTFETNVKGTWVLLEACRLHGGVARIVVASSDKAYGVHATLPYEEDAPLRGNHPYDVSKSCADLIATTYHDTWGLPVAITRCGNLFGPGDLNWNRLVPGTIRSILRGERPLIRSDGTLVRDYVHVQEIAQAYLLLAENLHRPEVVGRAFNFGTGEPVSVLQLTERLLRLSGREDLQPRILNEAHHEIPAQYLSARRARQVLGWAPQAPLDERLRETIAWYAGHLGLAGAGRA